MNDLLNHSGIYKITCKANGKFYIGSSNKIKVRMDNHKRNLNKGTHHSRSMQNSWKKYGESEFVFEVLLVCDKKDNLVYEQIYLDHYSPLFNTQKIARNNSKSGCPTENSKRETKASRIKYNWKGGSYSLSEISTMENFKYSLLRGRVINQCKTVQEAIEMGDSQIVYYEFNEESKSISEWARDFGVAQPRLYWYIKNGLTIEQALQKMQISEKKISLLEFCRLNSAVATTVKSRIKSGMSVMQAITTETKKMERKNG